MIGKRIHITAILLFIVVSVSAQTVNESIQSYSLDEFVISANRWCQQKEVQPVKITTMLFEESNRYNPQTAADVLGLTGEIFIQKSQYGGGSPMIRGFSIRPPSICI